MFVKTLYLLYGMLHLKPAFLHGEIKQAGRF
jgi:hypothetical protein